MAQTLEAAFQILTVAILANIGLLQTFVDIDTVHVCVAVLVAFRALAFETARYIHALGVSFARVSQTLVVVDALMGVFVVEVAASAHAFEASGSVHALSVLAHRWHQITFVDLHGGVGDGVDDLTRSWTTETYIFA